MLDLLGKRIISKQFGNIGTVVYQDKESEKTFPHIWKNLYVTSLNYRLLMDKYDYKHKRIWITDSDIKHDYKMCNFDDLEIIDV